MEQEERDSLNMHIANTVGAPWRAYYSATFLFIFEKAGEQDGKVPELIVDCVHCLGN